jgi:hypothetical protein
MPRSGHGDRTPAVIAAVTPTVLGVAPSVPIPPIAPIANMRIA